MPQSGNQRKSLLSASETVAGRYRVQRLLAQGIYSEVYLVDDTLLDGQFVALKLFDSIVRRDPRAFTALQQELLVSRTLRHPNILQLYDVSIGDCAHDYMTMEYVDGCSLDELVQSSRVNEISVEEAIYVFVELAAGISYAHQQNVIHRSINPEQALLSRRGDIRIRGCGRPAVVGRRMLYPSEGASLFVSPEEARDGTINEASNQYSLGLLLFGLLGGFDALNTSSERELLSDIRGLRAVPAWLAELLQTATEIDPKRRFDSVEQTLLFVEAQADIDSIEQIARDRLQRRIQDLRRVARRPRPSALGRSRSSVRFQRIPKEFRK